MRANLAPLAAKRMSSLLLSSQLCVLVPGCDGSQTDEPVRFVNPAKNLICSQVFGFITKLANYISLLCQQQVKDECGTTVSPILSQQAVCSFSQSEETYSMLPMLTVRDTGYSDRTKNNISILEEEMQ